jgi:hypothetical protein
MPILRRRESRPAPSAAVLQRGSFSFWRIVGERWSWRLFGYEGLAAAVIALAGGIPLTHLTKVGDRISTAGDFLTLISVVLGLMLAAFALIAAFMGDNYTLLLQRTGAQGVRGFFAVFMLNIGIDVGFVLAAVSYRSAASYLPHDVEKVFFVVLIFGFVYVILNIVAVTRTVMAHGVTRARLIELEEKERQQGASGI